MVREKTRLILLLLNTLLMTTLLIKLILMPTIMGLVTLVGRKWGMTIGGWVSSLPWVAGPISVFLALEQGISFAASAAASALAAVIGLVGFCWVYLRLVFQFSWIICSLAGLCTYIGIAVVFRYVLPLPAWVIFATVLTSVVIALRSLPMPRAIASPTKPPKYDIPLRMAVATVFVLFVTVLAQLLGTAWSGLLTPFPILTSILAAFTHHQQGADATVRIFRGLVYGLFGFTSFLFLVCLMVASFPIPVTYGIAFLVALSINMLTFRLLRQNT